MRTPPLDERNRGMVNDHLVDCFRFRTINRGLS